MQEAAMSNLYAISRKPVVPATTATDVHGNGAAPVGSIQKLHCKVGIPGGSGHQYTSEVAPLLRYRLRLATLITLVTFGIFLVRSFVLVNNPDGPTPIGLA